MEYTKSNLPVTLHHEDMIDLDGVAVRFETNGEAKDVYIGDAFMPTVQLFPATDYTFDAGGDSYTITAAFEDNITVSKA